MRSCCSCVLILFALDAINSSETVTLKKQQRNLFVVLLRFLFYYIRIVHTSKTYFAEIPFENAKWTNAHTQVLQTKTNCLLIRM